MKKMVEILGGVCPAINRERGATNQKAIAALLTLSDQSPSFIIDKELKPRKRGVNLLRFYNW